MGLSAEEIQESITYFEFQGGYCDCEVLFIVADRDADEPEED